MINGPNFAVTYSKKQSKTKTKRARIITSTTINGAGDENG
jgi:hypothetical protein